MNKPWRELVESGAVDLMSEADRLMLADLIEDELGRESAQAQHLRSNQAADGVLYNDGLFYPRTKNNVPLSFGDYAECVEYVNQSEYGDGQLEGDWFYADDVNCVLYSGSFGNYNSPGASGYTNAEVFDSREEYEKHKEEWEACPEYLEQDEEEDDEASSHAGDCPARYGGPCTRGCIEDEEEGES